MRALSVLLPMVVSLSACGGSSASCTTGSGVDKICYELRDGDSDDAETVTGACPGSAADEDCDATGALFRCDDTLFNFYEPAAAGEVRTLRYNYYFWNPANQTSTACENAGGTFSAL